MNISDLEAMAGKIEQDIKDCQNNLNKLGTLTIKTQSFINMLSKQSEDNDDVKRLKMKANSYLKSVKELGDKKAIMKKELEHEMEESKIRPKKINELDNHSMTESEFFSNQSSKLDEFISSSMDTIDSLKRQSRYIDNINGKLRQGVLNMGVNSDLLNQIETRFAGDKSIFIILLILIVIFIFVLRFAF